MRLRARITHDPEVLGGRACIRGLRITVANVLGQLAHGATPEEVLAAFPWLERADLDEALAYAAWLARERILPR